MQQHSPYHTVSRLPRVDKKLSNYVCSLEMSDIGQLARSELLIRLGSEDANAHTLLFGVGSPFRMHGNSGFAVYRVLALAGHLAPLYLRGADEITGLPVVSGSCVQSVLASTSSDRAMHARSGLERMYLENLALLDTVTQLCTVETHGDIRPDELLFRAGFAYEVFAQAAEQLPAHYVSPVHTKAIFSPSVLAGIGRAPCQ